MEHLKRCPAKVGESACGSAVFYDWGLELMNTRPASSLKGGDIEKFNDYATSDRIKICARCTTPYVVEGGEMIDISDELTAEDVKLVLARGQATLPHPKLKDP